MSFARVYSVAIESNGMRGESLMIDGSEIGHMVSGYSIYQDAGEVARVELTLAIAQTHRFEGEAYVSVTSEAARLLEMLGWTPPPLPA